MEDLVNTGDLKEKMSFLTIMISREEISRNDLVFFVHSMFSDGLATVSLFYFCIIKYEATTNYFHQVPSTLQSCIHCLAEHPEVQEKLFYEVSQNVNPLVPMTPAELDKLSYTKAVIKETFR